MRVLAGTLYYWTDAVTANRNVGTSASLYDWKMRVERIFGTGTPCFLASGSWSDPSFNPTPSITVVNAGLPTIGKQYSGTWHYAKCAITAAAAYALNIASQWDVCVLLDHSAVVQCDLHDTVSQFLMRPEIVCAPSWCGWPGGPFLAFKRDGLIAMLHSRICANLYDDTQKVPMVFPEAEWGMMFGNRWWNPWPEIRCMIQRGDFADDVAKGWPLVGDPSPGIVEDNERKLS